MPEEHPLTRLLMADGIALAAARHIYENAGDGEAGAAAARRYLDAELRAMVPWPSTGIYSRMAAEFDQAGQGRAGELLRDIAAAGKALDEGAQAWRQRYAARAPMAGEAMAVALRSDEDLVTWDPGGPYLGVDGALYQPGSMELPHGEEPVLIAEGRGTSEVITGWADFDEMQAWIADRGTGGSRELTEPPVRAMTRTWLEDTVLAYSIRHPREAAEALRALEPDAMTTDVRYEVLDAIRRIAGRDTGNRTPEAVSAEARARVAYAAPEGPDRYGGAHGPFIRTYVSRLAETEILEGDFRSAVRTLRGEDRQARTQVAQTAPPGRYERQEQHGTPAAATQPETYPDLPPRHAPGPEAGPVQGR